MKQSVTVRTDQDANTRIISYTIQFTEKEMMESNNPQLVMLSYNSSYHLGVVESVVADRESARTGRGEQLAPLLLRLAYMVNELEQRRHGDNALRQRQI